MTIARTHQECNESIMEIINLFTLSSCAYKGPEKRIFQFAYDSKILQPISN